MDSQDRQTMLSVLAALSQLRKGVSAMEKDEYHYTESFDDWVKHLEIQLQRDFSPLYSRRDALYRDEFLTLIDTATAYLKTYMKHDAGSSPNGPVPYWGGNGTDGLDGEIVDVDDYATEEEPRRWRWMPLPQLPKW